MILFYLFTFLFFYSFIYLFIHLFIYLYIYLFIYLFIYLLNYVFYLYVLPAGWSAINWQTSLKIYNDVWRYGLELNRRLYSTIRVYSENNCIKESVHFNLCQLLFVSRQSNSWPFNFVKENNNINYIFWLNKKEIVILRVISLGQTQPGKLLTAG